MLCFTTQYIHIFFLYLKVTVTKRGKAIIKYVEKLLLTVDFCESVSAQFEFKQIFES